MVNSLKMQFQHAVALVQSKLNDLRSAGQRSSKWPKVKNAFLKINPTCSACNGQVRLNVHHIEPFHLDPTKELDPTNLVTLCMEIGEHCHLLIGHGDDFKAYNPNVLVDSADVLKAHHTKDAGTIDRIEAMAKSERLYVLVSP